MKTIAVVTAAGRGTRMGGAMPPKQFIPLAGRPVLAHAIQAFQDCAAVASVVVTVTPGTEQRVRREVVDRYRLDKVCRLVEGGAERQDSVLQALLAIAELGGCDRVAIHDGARPLLDAVTLERALLAAAEHPALVVGIPVRDTIKETDASGVIQATPDRSRLWAAQTPQIFAFDIALRAYQEAARQGWRGTDDASLVERIHVPVRMVAGSPSNIKVTTPEDLEVAEALLTRRGSQGKKARGKQDCT